MHLFWPLWLCVVLNEVRHAQGVQALLKFSRFCLFELSSLYLVAIDHPIGHSWRHSTNPRLISLIQFFLYVLQNGGLGRPMGHMRLHNQSSVFCTRFSCDSDRWSLPFCSCFFLGGSNDEGSHSVLIFVSVCSGGSHFAPDFVQNGYPLPPMLISRGILYYIILYYIILYYIILYYIIYYIILYYIILYYIFLSRLWRFFCSFLPMCLHDSDCSHRPTGPETEWSILFRAGLPTNLNLVEVSLGVLSFWGLWKPYCVCLPGKEMLGCLQWLEKARHASMNAVMSTNVLQFHAPIESHLMKIWRSSLIHSSHSCTTAPCRLSSAGRDSCDELRDGLPSS